MVSVTLVKAVAEYLCRWGSVGTLRLTEDLLRRPDVRQALGLGTPPAPGSDMWWRAHYEIMEAVRLLETRGLAKVVGNAVINWLGKRCQ